MGWLVHGIKNAESVADHCYRMSLLSMILSDALVEKGIGLDTEKVMRLALLHEIAEVLIKEETIDGKRILKLLGNKKPKVLQPQG